MYNIATKAAPKMLTFRKRDRMHPNSLLTGLKRHAWTPRYDAFLGRWHSHKRFWISASVPLWKGPCGQMATWMADSCGNKGQLTNLDKGYLLLMSCTQLCHVHDMGLKKPVLGQRPLQGAHGPHRGNRSSKMPRSSNRQFFQLKNGIPNPLYIIYN